MTDLKEDDYVYTDLGVEKVHYCEVNGEKEMITPKGFIIGDVPDFKKWNWTKLENIRVNMENAKLKQQLAIAVEALEKYSDLNNWIEVCDGKCTFESISGTEDHLAQDVLRQIKELENA